MKVVLSAGHGAGDVGATNKDLQEATLTTKISERAAEMIRKHGVTALEVPHTLALQGTINWVNQQSGVDIAVEVHINSGGGKGVEGWNYAGVDNQSDRLSQFLVDAMAAETGLPNRGIKDETTNRHGRLGFVHDTNPIAVLVECGFIDGDYDWLKSDENLTRMAKGVARGMLSYLGIAWNPKLINPQPPTPPAPTTLADDLYRVTFKGKQIAALKNNPVVRIEQLEKENGSLQTKIENAKKSLS